MTVRKLSISVPSEVEETIKAAAAEEGKPVSAWLAEAATEKARAATLHAAGRAAARELVADTRASTGRSPPHPASAPASSWPRPACSTTSRSGPPGNAGHRLRHRRAPGRRTAQPRLPRPARRGHRRAHPSHRPGRRPGPGWRGGPQHQASRVLKGCDILPGNAATAAPRALPAQHPEPQTSSTPSSLPPPSATRPPSSPATRRPHPHRRRHRRQDPPLPDLMRRAAGIRRPDGS